MWWEQVSLSALSKYWVTFGHDFIHIFLFREHTNIHTVQLYRLITESRDNPPKWLMSYKFIRERNVLKGWRWLVTFDGKEDIRKRKNFAVTVVKLTKVWSRGNKLRQRLILNYIKNSWNLCSHTTVIHRHLLWPWKKNQMLSIEKQLEKVLFNKKKIKQMLSNITILEYHLSFFDTYWLEIERSLQIGWILQPTSG